MLLRRMLCASASLLMLVSACHLGTSAANASTIYSTFGPDDTYDGSSGWTIGGPGGFVQALQFTPAEGGVVQAIEIAAFRLAGGTAVNVTLTDDASDLPGLVLETLPICCFGDVASIQLANSVLHPILLGGTKYWLVVSPVAAEDHFGWGRNLDPPFLLNAQQSMGGPWSVGLTWRGAMRISGVQSTPTRATTWGRIKNLYR